MARKSKKTNKSKQVNPTSEWFQCNHCRVIVYFKDAQCHFEECSVNRMKNLDCGPGNLKHCCFTSGVLHVEVSEPNVKGLDWNCVPKIKNLILMHPSTMRLSKIAINDYVIVASNDYRALHVAWPSHSLDRRSVIFHTLKRYFHFHPGSMVAIQKYSSTVKEVEEITVLPTETDQEEFIYSEEFGRYVIDEFCGELLAVGMNITFKYWGSPVTLTVTKISPIELELGVFDEKQNVNAELENSAIQNTEDMLDKSISTIETLDDSSTDLSFDSSKLHNSSISFSTPVSSVTASHSNTFHNENFTTFHSFHDLNACDQSEKEYFQMTFCSTVTVQKTKYRSVMKNTTFKDIGGLNEELHIINKCTKKLFSPKNTGRIGAKMYEGMLFYGPSGTGKTFVADTIANECGLPFISVTANDVIVRHYGSEDKEVQKRFEEAIERAPSVLFLDAIDKLCCSKQNTTDKRGKRVLAVLINMFDKLKKNMKNPVLIVATVQELNSIHPMLRTYDRFGIEIEFKVPSPVERYEILQKLMENEPHSLTKEELSDISSKAHAYTGSDLAVLCCAARRLAVLRSMRNGIRDEEEIARTVSINFVDVTNALKKVTPFSMMIQEVKIEKVSWDDICGMYEVKKKLKQAVEWPLKFPEIFSNYNINPTSGILMHGPPGCSKTMLAKALASESGLNFIPVKGPELFNKFYGESERAVRELFARARASKPCIIFLDEVDALLIGRESSSDGSDVGRKVVCQFLSEFGGIGASDGIIVIAATNRPDILDEAVLRPGRIGELIEIPLPDAETRKEILQKKLKEMPVSDDIDFDLLVEETKGFSGAQVVASCKEVAWLLVEEDFTESGITMPMMLQAIQVIRKPDATNLDDYD